MGLDSVDMGVAGAVLTPFRKPGSEVCLSLVKLKRPARLGRPTVEVEVREDPGIGGTSLSLRSRRVEPAVDDLPRFCAACNECAE